MQFCKRSVKANCTQSGNVPFSPELSPSVPAKTRTFIYIQHINVCKTRWLPANFYNAGQFQTNHLKPLFVFALKGTRLLIAAQLGQDLCSVKGSMFSQPQATCTPSGLQVKAKILETLVLALGKTNLFL